MVVVDHGPRPGLGAALDGGHPQLTVLPSLGNPGFGPGCNLGAQLAFREGAPAVWFLNNDATLEGETLGPLLDLAGAHPQVVLWGTRQRDGERLLDADLQAPWFARAGAAERLALPADCRQLEARESLSGASILVTRAGWERLGPWPEDLFLYLEDSAWCQRAHALGLAMAIVQRPVRHPRSSTIGKRSRLSIYYGVRNTLLLHRRLHPGAGPARLAMALHLLQKRLFQGRLGLLPATLQGILAGFSGQTGRDPRY